MLKRHFRLDPRVRPVRYTLHFDLDLDAWTFSGTERLEFETADERREIVLHARDLELASVANCEATLEPEAEALVLRFAKPLAPGPHAIALAFTGLIRPDLKALYRSTNGDERYAITTLWPAESRRVFPCFDEPPFKARFALSLTVPTGTTAIANAQVISRDVADAGRTQWRFAETPPLSPYLLAFAVGPFEGTPETRTKAGVPVRVWVPRGLAKDALYARDAQRDAIDWLVTYTGIAYPYDKVEGVGVRDFPAGAMENPGAVTYRLELVAADPKTASTRALKDTVSVAAHELTHMWWGDLATLAWWDDLWLSESFATFVGTKAENAMHPEWRVWRDFVIGTAFGFRLDALATTHAIHDEAESAEDALQRVDAVTYQKGASVLRMFEAYLGEDAFRAGVRLYLERFAGASATATDFWKALSDASDQDVARVADAWIGTPGHPIVELSGTPRRLRLRQQRFFADPDMPASAQRWPIPLVLRTAGAAHRVVFDSEETTLELADPLVFPNAGAAGFYRFSLSSELRDALLPGAGALDPLERLAWVDNTWTLVQKGAIGVAEYVTLLRALAGERDRAVLMVIAEHLSWIATHALHSAARGAFSALVEALYRPVFERLGLEPGAADDDDDRELRSVAVRMLGAVGRADDIRRESARRIRMHLDGDRQTPDLIESFAEIAAVDGDVTLHGRYAARMREATATDPQDEQRFLGALGAFGNEAATRATLALIDSGAIRSQDIRAIYRAGLRNPEARERYWRDLRDRYATTIAPLEAMVRNGVLMNVSQLTSPALVGEADAFLASITETDSREVMARVRESLRLQSRAAARISRELAAALR